MADWRSYLFVPAEKRSMMDKAVLSEADSVIFDLEDAVAWSKKKEARELVKEALQANSKKKPIYVRVNNMATPYWEEDLTVSIQHGAVGVFVPKSEKSQDLKRMSEFIRKFQHLGSKNEVHAAFEVIPIIETAKGVYHGYDIASADPLVTTLAFGSIDFSLDVGCELTESGEELLFSRSQLVIAARAASKLQPIDSVYPELNHFEGLLRETKRSKALGFGGKLIIHPQQIAPVHEGFRPSQKQMLEAKRIVEQFANAEKNGVASISVNNRLVDYPVYKKAQALLSQYNGVES